MNIFLREGKVSPRIWTWAIVIGWLSLFAIKPAVDAWNTVSPVYAPPTAALVVRDGRQITISGRTVKRVSCPVRAGDLTHLLVSWHQDGDRHFRKYLARRPDDGETVPTGALYRRGEGVPIGPFRIDLVGEAAMRADTVEVSLTCLRWGMFPVEARIGPFPIPGRPS